jgi:hypothetical protein
MVKVMNGYSPWTAERQMSLDVIPIHYFRPLDFYGVGLHS